MDRRDLAVKIEDGGDGGGGGGGKIWRESSYDFWHDKGKQSDSGFDFMMTSGREDPPSKLIGQFLHKQKASGEVCLDMDSEMAELQNDNSSVPRRTNTSTTSTPRSSQPPVAESPLATHRFSFDPNPLGSAESIRRRSQFMEEHGGGDGHGGGAEVVKCSSSREGSFHRKSSLLKEKTKSRLTDPPERMGRSGLIRTVEIRIYREEQ